MTPGRRAAVLAGAALAGMAALVPSSPAGAADAGRPGEPPAGLFGEADPRRDAVRRQSLALLAQDTVGYTPAREAVDWLLGQQCADGSFLTYRAGPDVPCRDVTAADTTATALAVQALAALGGTETVDAAVSSAVRWLSGVQNADGGWGRGPGGVTDASATAAVVGALTAAGEDPSGVRREGSSPYEALAALQKSCDAEESPGAFAASRPDTGGDGGVAEPPPDVPATVDAVLASYGSGLVVVPGVTGGPAPLPPPSCGTPDPDRGDGSDDAEGGGESPESGEATAGEATAGETAEEEADGARVPPAVAASASAGAAHLAALLEENDRYLPVAATARETPPVAGAGEGTAASGDGEDSGPSRPPGGSGAADGTEGPQEGTDAEAPQDGERDVPAVPDYAATARAVLALAAGGHSEMQQQPLDWLTEHHAAWPDLTGDPAAVALLVLAAEAGDAAPEDFGGTDLVSHLNGLGPEPDEAPATAAGAAGGAADAGSAPAALLWVTGGGLLAGIVLGVRLSLRRARGAAAPAQED